MDLCERFSARVFVIEQWRSNTARSRFFRLAHELYTGSDPDQVKRNLSAALWYYAPDDRVRKTLDEPLDWYHRQGHKYFLYEYELSLLAPGEQLPQLMTFTDSRSAQKTTEHILPQTADDPCWTRAFTDEEHAKALHTLGNLVLTLDNSSYSNKCFKDERGEPAAPGGQASRCYAQGKLHQERELAQYPDWTPETIVERQRRLADWALERWHVDEPASAQPVDLVDLEPDGDQEDADALAGAERCEESAPGLANP